MLCIAAVKVATFLTMPVNPDSQQQPAQVRLMLIHRSICFCLYMYICICQILTVHDPQHLLALAKLTSESWGPHTLS